MADMFYFCSPPAPVKYAGSSIRRHRRPVRKRSPSSRAANMERACMARFAEPVFCSTLFTIFTQQPDISTLQNEPWIDHDEQHLAQGAQDSLDETGKEVPAPGVAPSGAAASHNSAGDAVQVMAIDDESRLRRPPTQCEETSQEAGQHLRTELDGSMTGSLRRFEMRSDPLARSRTVSHQPSCDSLRNYASTTESIRSMTPLGASHIVTENLQAPLSDDMRSQYENLGQYTVLTDMVESAWSVDDPRYGSDVLDSLSWWNLSAPEARVTAALAERANAHGSTLPVINRQESLCSGVDMQGIHWDSIGWRRQRSLNDRANNSSSPIPSLDAQVERHYSFRSFDGTKRPKFAHHQLRHVLASVDRDVYYTTSSKVMRASLACPVVDDTVVDLTRSRRTQAPIRITCLTATDSAVLIAGGFDGEYALRRLDSSDPHSEGYVTRDRNGLVTHIHTFSHRRSGLLQAAFCANDQHLRLMDIATETFTKTLVYDHSLNNAVTARDGRLRLLVGDSTDALVTDAESGETLATLDSHTDHIFACAWSPDERFLATGAQDGKVALWDPRNWSEPFAELQSALSCSRSLHFTSDGSKLISAENEDVVSVFDMRSSSSFEQRRQDICFFGTIAGVTLLDGGEEIVVANGDRSVGGLISFRRTPDVSVPGALEGTLDPVEKSRRRAVRRRNDRRAIGVVEEFVL